jgi:tRNA-splicing ligase RtcB
MKLIDAEGYSIPAWIDDPETGRKVAVDENALEQLRNVARLPFVVGIAVMPDVHAGKGSTIGTVFAVRDAIVPAAVGVDIGCGVLAAKTTLTRPVLESNLASVGQDLAWLRKDIERRVPHGRTNNGGAGDRGAWHSVPEHVRDIWFDTDKSWGDLGGRSLAAARDRVVGDAPRVASANAISHLGTLGTGNHFVELDVDRDDNVWILVHSGSRGIGAAIGQHYAKMALEGCRAWHVDLPDPALAFIPRFDRLFENYFYALHFAMHFARINRQLIAKETVAALDSVVETAVVDKVEAPHNYVNTETFGNIACHVIRKGAIHVPAGTRGVVPGSMGTRSYIVVGKGCPRAMDSCSHGAGRAMSRTAAKATFNVADHAAATVGVECRKDVDVLDETPGAYKDIDLVMACQRELVEIENVLTPFLCVKG